MRLTARSLLIGLAALAFAGAAAPAAAHPLGDPQTVRLSAEGERVTAVWTAPPDDLLVLGSITGALSDRREYVFDLGTGGEPEPVGDTDAELLIASPEVADYLASHISVTQDGRACPAEVDLTGLVEEGAELVFTCETTVEAVDVHISMLTDADPSYRTVAFADAADPQQQLYTADQAAAEWRFDTAASGPGWVVPAALGVVLLLVAAVAVVALRQLGKAAK